MTKPSTPALSVVLATPGDYEMIRRTIGFLRVQTVADTVELVIVAPSKMSSHETSWRGSSTLRRSPSARSNRAVWPTLPVSVQRERRLSC